MSENVALTAIVGLVIGVVAIVAIALGSPLRAKASKEGFEMEVGKQRAPANAEFRSDLMVAKKEKAAKGRDGS